MPQPQDRRCALENIKGQQYDNPRLEMRGGRKKRAETRDRTGDLQIFSLTLSQLSYRGCCGYSIPMPICFGPR